MYKENENVSKAPEIIFSDIPSIEAGSSKSEAALYRRLTRSIAEGDTNAWEEVYLLLYDPVATFTNRIIRSQEDAYDIAQEVFIVLWKNRSKVDPEKNIKGYIYTITKTLALKYLRDKIRTDEFAPASHAYDLTADELSPDNIIMAEEINMLVRLALESMPKQRRLVFEMSRKEGLSYDEIAEKLGLSKRTVENHIYNVTKELKELLYMTTIILLKGTLG